MSDERNVRRQGENGDFMTPPFGNSGSVSVVVPAYNATATIREAIASVDAQTCRPLEILIVDDASADGTAALLREAYGTRQDIRLILFERNQGPAAARNAAIAGARGEWLAFLDGDDAWLPYRLEIQLQAAGIHPDVDLWCGAVVPLTRGAGPEARAPSVVPPWRDLPLAEFALHNAVATSTVLARRTALRAAGGFDPQFVGPEDYELWMRMAARGRLVRIEHPLSRYRLIVGSLSMDDRRFLPQVLRVLEKGFGPGGALTAHGDQRQVAVATQYWNASWMAFNRGARLAALRYWWRAWRLDHRSVEAGGRPWRRLLWRYLVGKREGESL